MTGQPGGGSSDLRAEDLRRLPSRLRRRFERLPLAVKAVLAALVLLALFTVLSPVAAVAATLAFCVSLIALIVRIGQPRSVVRWGIAAATSLVLALVLAGVAGVFYGGGFTAGTASESRGGYAQEDRGNGGAGSSAGGAGDSEDASGETYANPVDVYLVMNDAVFMDGYLLVNQTSEGSFFHAHNLDHQHYASGEVSQGGELYLHGYVGDLDDLDYACTYDGDDPRGGEVAMEEACGFSPMEE